MSFVPPPSADDVPEGDLGPYSRREVIMARRTLLHTMGSSQPSLMPQRLQQKLGILPSGQRLLSDNQEPMWIPRDLPAFWSAPVVLHDPETELHGGQGQGREMSDGHLEVEQKRDQECVLWGSGAVEDSHYCNLSSQKAHPTSCCIQPMSSSLSSNPVLVVSDSKREGYGCRGKNASTVHLDDPKVCEPSSWQLKSPSSDQKLQQQEGGPSETESISSANFSTAPAADRCSSSQKDTCQANISESSAPQTSGECQTTETKLGEREQGGERRTSYKVMFQCDLCAHTCIHENAMMKHLRMRGHYSASRYLGSVSTVTGELLPRYLSSASLLKDERNIFKHKVPVCPKCHAAFSDVWQCSQHSAQNHQAEGVYTLRIVVRSKTLQMHAMSDNCYDCGAQFKQNGLRKHILETKHMHMYAAKKSCRTMMCFPCHFCKVIHTNYFAYKQHVFSKHAREAESNRTLPGTCLTLSKRQATRHLLPKDPGIPSEMINSNFSKEKLHGVPGIPTTGTSMERRKKNRALKRPADFQATGSSANTSKEEIAMGRRKQAKAESRKKRKAQKKKRLKQDAKNKM